MAKGKKSNQTTQQPRLTNRKARYEFEILERVEAGIALKGSEVKSLRRGDANLSDAYARVDGDRVVLINFQIEPYKEAGVFNHEPKRLKHLLLHKREIKKIKAKVLVKGQTLVPLAVYFNENGKAKVDLAVARGKSKGDKRQAEKKREDQKEMTRIQRRGGL